jgi:hypothetical protein
MYCTVQYSMKPFDCNSMEPAIYSSARKYVE